MGQVYRATDNNLKRQVAIKVLVVAAWPIEQAERRVLEERLIPACVACRDSGS